MWSRLSKVQGVCWYYNQLDRIIKSHTVGYDEKTKKR